MTANLQILDGRSDPYVPRDVTREVTQNSDNTPTRKTSKAMVDHERGVHLEWREARRENHQIKTLD
jgi:hypothetical protein